MAFEWRLSSPDNLDQTDDRNAICAAALCIGFQSLLLTWVSWSSAPNCDELGHLASGLYHWNTGRFDAYKVNPPLVRMWATLPLLTCPTEIDWHGVGSHWKRLEWVLADLYTNSHSADVIHQHLFLARVWCLPFSALGGLTCFAWSRDHYGNEAAVTSLILWSFSPNVITWGATLGPDLPATALGGLYFYLASCWLGHLNVSRTILLGFLTGVLILSKSTWIILLGISPILILTGTPLSWRQLGIRISILVTVSIATLILAFGCDSFCQPFADDSFHSSLFKRTLSLMTACANNLQTVHLPLPKPFIEGLDLQRSEFENKKWSYLCGQWKMGGWWHYYLLAAAWKIPLALWCLALISFAACRKDQNPIRRWQRSCLLIPPLAIFILASSQVGFSRHLRYVALCLPFVIVWASKATCKATSFPQPIQQILICWYVLSSAGVAPYFHSYFNELAGGPTGGHQYLLDSNVDWGEDLYRAKTWATRYPQARPLYYAFMNDQFARTLDVDWQPAKNDLPGWYLISIHRLHELSSDVSWLRKATPIGRIGYSTLVFSWRREKEAIGNINETSENLNCPVAGSLKSH